MYLNRSFSFILLSYIYIRRLFVTIILDILQI